VQRREALIGQADERASAVVGVGAAGDEPVALEIADRLRHRLRADALGDGEVADALRTLAVEPPEHGAVRDRKAMLGAQPAHQLPEHDAQLARKERRIGRRRHGGMIAEPTGKLHRLPVYFWS
jgi:hypothetical protein